jgi:hypothetical protein
VIYVYNFCVLSLKKKIGHGIKAKKWLVETPLEMKNVTSSNNSEGLMI